MRRSLWPEGLCEKRVLWTGTRLVKEYLDGKAAVVLNKQCLFVSMRKHVVDNQIKIIHDCARTKHTTLQMQLTIDLWRFPTTTHTHTLSLITSRFLSSANCCKPLFSPSFAVLSSPPVSDLFHVSHVSLRLISSGYWHREARFTLTLVCQHSPPYSALFFFSDLDARCGFSCVHIA